MINHTRQASRGPASAKVECARAITPIMLAVATQTDGLRTAVAQIEWPYNVATQIEWPHDAASRDDPMECVADGASPSTDTICAIIDAVPWSALNSIGRLNVASAAYFRSRKHFLLTRWSRLDGLPIHFDKVSVNFARYVLPNAMPHGPAIVRNSDGTRFKVIFDLGVPVFWSYDTAADMSAVVWRADMVGTFKPLRGQRTVGNTAANTTDASANTITTKFVEIIRGRVVRTTVFGDRCVIALGNDAHVIVVRPIVLSADHTARNITSRNTWYDLNVSRHVDRLVGDGKPHRAKLSFARTFARQPDERIRWFEERLPELLQFNVPTGPTPLRR